MNDKILIKNELRNAKAKRLLEKVLLEYSKEIIDELSMKPEMLPEILDALEITKVEFFSYISGDVKGNISFYDQTLCLIKKKTKDK